MPRGYVPNHKIWDRMGRVTPNVEYSPGERPHFESFAAPWLPVVRYEQELDYWITISAGKVVAEDKNGHLVPAGFRKLFNQGALAPVLSYSITDVQQGVIDLTTGAPVAGPVAYTEAGLTTALANRGLIRPGQRAMDFISKPIGVASYNYYKAAGEDHWDPSKLYQHNFRPQALTAVTCDYVITVPVVPAAIAQEVMDGAIANLANSINWTATRTGGWFGSTALNGLAALSDKVAVGDNVVGYVFENFPLAHITSDTPIVHTNANGENLLTNKVAGINSVIAAGDYFVDYDLGILFLYEAGGNAIPNGFLATDTIQYFHYQGAAPAMSSYMCATGDISYGDFLTYDMNSNLVKANLSIANAEGYDEAGVPFVADPDFFNVGGNANPDADDNAAISSQIAQAIDNHVFGVVGQVIGTNVYPRGALDKVKTAYHGYAAANMRTPGSATGGRTDQLTYAGAAEKMAIVNLILR